MNRDAIRRNTYHFYKYVDYRINAVTLHKVHPPLAFEVMDHILSYKIPEDSEKRICAIRQSLCKSTRVIDFVDFGAKSGAVNYRRSYKKVCTIARNAAITKKKGKLLYALIDYFKPENILEFGTSLGLSALYQALANPEAKIITLEGCSELAGIANHYLKKAQVSNVQVFEGVFSQTMSIAVNTLKSLDFVYFDGNHKKEPTLEFFNFCLNYAHENSIFVFDDIHWSKEMSEAWDIICDDPRVSLSISTFDQGIVFFKKGLTKQNYVIKY